MEPASIRYKNPGAMWGNPIAIKWGAKKKPVTLNDGKGQGNNIAVFPTYVQGICAQLDLWRTSKNYRNKRFADAIAIWSGHNEVPSYIAFCKKRVPGLTEDTIMNDAFWRSSKGIAFLQAQAWHEAGKRYPAPDADWIEAQRRVFEDDPPKPAISDLADAPKAFAAPTPAALPADPQVAGDPELWSVQRRLDAMNYNPGDLDGVWGGMTAGAISGFLNDRGSSIVAPTSLETFNAIHDDLKAELGRAEMGGYRRPVSAARASGDIAVVAKAAPEVVPVHRNFLATAWAAVVAFFTAIYNAVSDKIGQAWDFFTDHKDDIPSDSGFLHTVWGYLGKVPTTVWLLLAAAGLGFLAINSFNGVKKISDAVKTGERQ